MPRRLRTRASSSKEVYLEREVSDADRFGRLLRDVWIVDSGGSYVLVNLDLVRLGYAQLSTFPPDVRYVRELTEAQAAAQSEGAEDLVSTSRCRPRSPEQSRRHPPRPRHPPPRRPRPRTWSAVAREDPARSATRPTTRVCPSSMTSTVPRSGAGRRPVSVGGPTTTCSTPRRTGSAARATNRVDRLARWQKERAP